MGLGRKSLRTTGLGDAKQYTKKILNKNDLNTCVLATTVSMKIAFKHVKEVQKIQVICITSTEWSVTCKTPKHCLENILSL